MLLFFDQCIFYRHKKDEAEEKSGHLPEFFDNANCHHEFGER